MINMFNLYNPLLLKHLPDKKEFFYGFMYFVYKCQYTMKTLVLF
jgi:hypothetical protein